MAAVPAKHLHAVGANFGGVALYAVLVRPCACCQAAFNVNLAAFFQVFTDDFRLAAEEGYTVPFGALLLFSVLVFPCVGGGQRQVCNSIARR